jgi:transcription antitermination factor NusG
VSSALIQLESIPHLPELDMVPESAQWYAVHTKARHEKRVAERFEEKRVTTFLPLLTRIHKWSDRLTKVQVPMFSCYAFVRVNQSAEQRLKVLRTPGVLGFVGSEGQGTPIPDEEIESLQTAIHENLPCLPHPFLTTGSRVRIRGGSLDGMQGILVGHAGEATLVVSVELLRRSVSIRVEGYDVESA